MAEPAVYIRAAAIVGGSAWPLASHCGPSSRQQTFAAGGCRGSSQRRRRSRGSGERSSQHPALGGAIIPSGDRCSGAAASVRGDLQGRRADSLRADRAVEASNRFDCRNSVCVDAAHPPPPPQLARPTQPSRPTTPCLHRGVMDVRVDAFGAAATTSSSSTALASSAAAGPTPATASHTNEDVLPPRPTTPCPNSSRNLGSDAARRCKRMNSAGASGRQPSRRQVPSGVSIENRMSEFENAFLGTVADIPGPSLHGPPTVFDSGNCGNAAACTSGVEFSRSSVERPSSSCRGGGGGQVGIRPFNVPSNTGASLTADHCSGPLNPQTSYEASIPHWSSPWECQLHAGSDLEKDSVLSPRSFKRPDAPTPEQTHHWFRGLETSDESPEHFRTSVESNGWGSMGGCGAGPAGVGVAAENLSEEANSCTQSMGRQRLIELRRPRSPTPTKMLAWKESGRNRTLTSPGDESDHESLVGNDADSVIAKLLQACQMNDVNRAFSLYETLQQMSVPLYEGVYKLIIECCMRTHRLGNAIQFYEMLKGSGQRISSRLATLLIEGCAKEQHSDKVYAIWREWCPSGESWVPQSHGEVLLATVSALIRTLSPDLAKEVLCDALVKMRSAPLASMFLNSEVQLEELLLLNEAVAEEAHASGALLAEGLKERFVELHATLESLRQRCLHECAATASRASEGVGVTGRGRGRSYEAELLMMEDVDLDLAFAD